MHESTMTGIFWKIMVLAMLLPVITGFDGDRPQPNAPATPKDAPGFELQQKTPRSPEKPGLPGADYNWRRDKVQEPHRRLGTKPGCGQSRLDAGNGAFLGDRCGAQPSGSCA